MSTQSSNNKRIAKNTLLLYFRMLFLMTVSLYTSRVILDALGIEDFGIYNVVGGVVALFSMVSGALNSAITRFITYTLAKRDTNELKETFSCAMTIQIILGILLIITIESVGVWFLNNKMSIPDDRLFAANYILQFSLLTFFVNLVSLPYNATIIAHERMSAFAYIGILEAIGKLTAAYLIFLNPFDRLIYYGLLMAVIAIAIRFVYSIYCTKHFEECYYRFSYNPPLLKKMLGFAGWNFIGATSFALREQGGNVMINLFCGPAVNAAKGVATQVNAAVYGFVTNFTTAANPQITKMFATRDYQNCFILVRRTSLFSYYLLLLLSLPVIICAQYILSLWLKTVPEHTVSLVQLVLLFSMSEALSAPLITLMLATGKVRIYQLIVGGIQLLNLPLAYILLSYYTIPELVLVIAIILSHVCLYARLVMLRMSASFPIRKFIFGVYLKVIIVSAISVISPLITLYALSADNLVNVIIISTICIISSCCTIISIGCSRQERNMITVFIKKTLHGIYKRKK